MSWLTPRWPYLLAIALVIPLGLSTRSAAVPWPALVAEHGGDVLYASMAYLGFRMLRPGDRPPIALGLAVGACFAIELFQLYQAPWIQAVRRTLPGRLVLGSGFEWVDFARYTAGAVGAWALDVGALNHRQRRRGRQGSGAADAPRC